MKKGTDLVAFGNQLVGRPYVFGIFVPKNDKNWNGGFDCAEFAAYCIFQIAEVLIGCDTHKVENAYKADAYSGYFVDEVKSKIWVTPITIEEAAQLQGAFVVRAPKAGAIGHIAMTIGNGKTVEAHSTKYGTINSVVSGRKWDYAFKVVGIDYTGQQTAPVKLVKPTVYELKSPMMKSPEIEKLQIRLKELGFYKENKTDEYFGPKLNNAVIAFQRKEGLIVDGDVMVGGETARALGLILK